MYDANLSSSTARSTLINATQPQQATEMSLEQRLFDAIVGHDRAAIKGYLQHPGIDFSQVNQDGQTFLHVAAGLGDAETVSDLIQYYKDEEAVLLCHGDDWRARICSAAISMKLYKTVNDFKFLDAQDRQGFSALMLAGRDGHLEVMRVLLGAGVDVNDIAIPISVAHADAERADRFYGPNSQGQLERDPERLLHDLPELQASKFGHTAIMLATENAQALAITLLLKAGVTLTSNRDAPLGRGYTLLMMAAKTGHVPSAEALIAAGADVNAPSRNRRENAMTVAAQYDRAHMIHVLLDAGASANNRATRGHNPLAAAARYGKTQAIRALHTRGANLERETPGRMTPLLHASVQGHAAAIETLLDLGANLHAVDENGKNALTLAVENRHPAAIATLIQRGALDGITPSNGQNLMAFAAQHGCVELIEALLKIGVEIDAPDASGMTALMTAAQYGQLSATQALLRAGASTEARNINGYTPIAIAAQSNQPDIIRMLHANGANLEARTAQHPLPADAPLSTPHESGKTPLLIAADAGHLDCVATLIELGADINARDNHGSTALTLSTERRHIDVISTLIDNGANLELRNADKQTPFMIAAAHRDGPLMVDLHAVGADINAVDINAGPAAGSSPLLLAIETNDVENFALLMLLQADVNLGNAAGISPLRAAIEHGKLDMVRTLIDGGADVNAADHNGLTPFMAASRLNQVDIMRVLFRAGANTRATNAGGHDARTLATHAGAREAEDFLLKELGWAARAPQPPGRLL